MRTQGVLVAHRDPITGVKDVWELDLSLSLQENIASRYPDGLDHEMVTLSINGEIKNPLECRELLRKATSFDRVDLVFRQQGFDPISIAIIAAVAIAASLAVVLLTPKPEIPNGVGSRKDSPNNSLSAQTNIARPYQAIPDIYGRVRAYPDLIQASVEEYIGQVKYITEWMCLGIGSYTVENQRFADTPLANISGSSSTVYQPNATIPQIVEYFPSPEVDGQELLGTNEADHDWIGPFFSDAIVDDIWVNLVLPRGVFGPIDYRFEFYPIDSDGNQVYPYIGFFNGSFSGSNFSEYYQTIKLNASNLFGNIRQRFAIRVRRTNAQKNDSQQPDQLKVEKVAFIRYQKNVNFGNVTIYKVTTKATIQATGLRERKFNVDATRKVISKDSYTLQASRSFADAVLHSYEIVAGQDRSKLDVDGLYAISDSLSDTRLGRFDFSFDDVDISLGQRLQTICNAARVSVYKDGGIWRFTREESRPFPVAQFDRRTLASGDYQLQSRSALPSSFNGVELEYVDPVKNKKSFIKLKITGSGIETGISSRPYKIQLAGCRDPFQAMNRAHLEARRIIYQRDTVKDTVLGDPTMASFGDMVRWIDSYDVAVNDGEILDVQVIPGGYRFLTSEPIKWEVGKVFRATITDESGLVSTPAIAVERPDNKNGFDANIVGWYTANDGVNQLGSRYLVTTEQEEDAALFVITNKSPGDDGTVGIEMSQYDERMFEYDQEGIPSTGFFLKEDGDFILKEDFSRLILE